MALMYPKDLPPETYSVGEQQLFEMLREQLSDDYVVLHAVDWIVPDQRRRPEQGEIDFVVLHPDLGVVILEVKGAQAIDIVEGRWQSFEEGGRTPPQQMRRNDWGLHAMLRSAVDTRSFTYNTKCGLVFTNLTISGDWVNRDLHRSEVIDFQDCQDLPRAIRRVADERSPDQTLSTAAIDAAIRLLARDVQIRAPQLYVQLQAAEQRFVELGLMQRQILKMLHRAPRLAIPGCAGSGKTMLAMEHARMLARRGLRVLLTCYTADLARTMRERIELEPEPALDLVQVDHFHGLARRMLGEDEFNRLVQESGPDEDAYGSVIPDTLVSRLPEIEERFDAVVVDEGQDFDELPWLALDQLLDQPGEGIFHIFFDNNQRIFRQSVTFPVEISNLELSINFRNTDQIHEWVRRYHQDPDSLQPASIDGPAPEVLPASAGEELRVLQRLLDRLINREQILPEQVAILTPLGANNKATLFTSDDRRLGRFKLTRERVEDSTSIPVRTIHAFKGMESPIVILTELERAYKPKLVELLYIGTSRARSQLYVVGAVPEILKDEDALPV